MARSGHRLTSPPMATVIVVTDADWIENDVRASLTDRDTDIHAVADPRQAVGEAERLRADVAVIDLQVGSMGGMAVVRALRAAMDADQIRPLRTIMLLDRTADGFLARRAGADAFVVKPFTAQELRRAAAPTPQT